MTLLSMFYVTFTNFFPLCFLFTENPKDWSDHALWWPAKNVWLTRTRSTLDQCGVQADSLLHFTPMHKTLRVQVRMLIEFFGRSASLNISLFE